MKPVEKLRIELNRHRAYIRQARENIKKGVNKKSTLAALDIRCHDFVILRNTIKKINKIRPVYTWTMPIR